MANRIYPRKLAEEQAGLGKPLVQIQMVGLQGHPQKSSILNVPWRP